MAAKRKAGGRGLSESGAEFRATPKSGSVVGTVVSTKGQVILPKAIRDRKGWRAGTKLVIEETPAGVTLRPENPFPPTKLEDVVGILKYHGPPKTIEEMDLAVRRRASREYRRSVRDRD